MDIKNTIEFIDSELSITLNKYNDWFNLDSDIIKFIPQVGWSIEQILEHVTLTNIFY